MTPLARLARSVALPFGVLTSLSACGSPGWEAGRAVLADPRSVAAALGDPAPDARLAVRDLPDIGLPHHARLCCALGMDLEVDFAGLQVPFFVVGGVVGADELGAHGYDLPDGATDTEGNGLVYTCRGGWIDTAHVRENADNVLFLALRIAQTLATGTTIEIPGHGGATTITVAPVPASTIAREGPMAIAGALAAWTAFRISIWHEVTTWYGYQLVLGFGERHSTFSPEDLYSNALGIRLGSAILDERGFGTDDEYDLLAAAFIEEALDRLEAQPREAGRSVMAWLDGRWWDSTRRMPDNRLVLRRAFPPEGDHVRPWRAEDAFAPGEVPAELDALCGGARPRPLAVPTGIGRLSARDVVSISWAPEAWATGTLPFADPARHTVEDRELERLVADVHDQLEAELGTGFDAPGPRAAHVP